LCLESARRHYLPIFTLY